MSSTIAKNNYIGLNGCKMNCAQSVISAFKDKFDIEDELIQQFNNFGGGRAPNGLCGALYAVKYIISRQNNDQKINELEKYFLEQAGALDCRSIRGLKKLSCVGCVEKSSEFLEKLA